MKTIINELPALYLDAAERILELISEKPGLTLALSGEREALGVYDMLLELKERKGLSFEKLTVFSVQEFSTLNLEDDNSLNKSLLERFVRKSGMMEENFYPLTDESCESFDELIAAKGGLDAAIVNIGDNARFGFNEPATQFLTYTHSQKLTKPTREEFAAAFSGEENVPERGLTMGVKTVTGARNIIALAIGESRAKALYKTLYGRDDSVVPSAFLQLPPNVLVYADSAAAGEL